MADRARTAARLLAFAAGIAAASAWFATDRFLARRVVPEILRVAPAPETPPPRAGDTLAFRLVYRVPAGTPREERVELAPGRGFAPVSVSPARQIAMRPGSRDRERSIRLRATDSGPAGGATVSLTFRSPDGSPRCLSAALPVPDVIRDASPPANGIPILRDLPGKQGGNCAAPAVAIAAAILACAGTAAMVRRRRRRRPTNGPPPVTPDPLESARARIRALRDATPPPPEPVALRELCDILRDYLTQTGCYGAAALTAREILRSRAAGPAPASRQWPSESLCTLLVSLETGRFGGPGAASDSLTRWLDRAEAVLGPPACSGAPATVAGGTGES